MLDIFKKLFGGKHEKDVKAITPLVAEINRHADAYLTLSDDELRAKTDEFRGRIAEALQEVQEDLTQLRSKLNPDLEGAEREKRWRSKTSLKRNVTR